MRTAIRSAPRSTAIDALDGPAVIVIDDVQWIDAASAEVLAAIANRSEDLGVLLVTASRPHTGAARHFEQLRTRRRSAR